MIGEQIKIVSANCRGLRDNKRLDVCNYLLKLNPNILFLMDTHLTKPDENDLNLITNCKCLLSGARTNFRGVAILIQNNFNYKIINVTSDDEGNYIYVDSEICSVTFRLINIYTPSNDTPSFFHNIDNLLVGNNWDHSVICGDFNLVLNPFTFVVTLI